MEDGPDIFKVDFRKRIVVEQRRGYEESLSHMIDQRIALERIKEEKNIARTALTIVQSFRESKNAPQDVPLEGVYRRTLSVFQDRSLEELKRTLSHEREKWKERPQFYAAIADLLLDKASALFRGAEGNEETKMHM